MKEYIVPACEPGEKAWPVTEFAIISLVEKGLDPSTLVNPSVDSDSEAVLWVGYYSNRDSWPPPDEKEIGSWTDGTYRSRQDVPPEGHFPNGVGLLRLRFARGFGPPIPALTAFASEFLVAACGRDQPDLARAALAAGADPEARYISVPEEWLRKRENFLREL